MLLVLVALLQVWLLTNEASCSGAESQLMSPLSKDETSIAIDQCVV
jgi:hypothetical protein